MNYIENTCNMLLIKIKNRLRIKISQSNVCVDNIKSLNIKQLVTLFNAILYSVFWQF